MQPVTYGVSVYWGYSGICCRYHWCFCHGCRGFYEQLLLGLIEYSGKLCSSQAAVVELAFCELSICNRDFMCELSLGGRLPVTFGIQLQNSLANRRGEVSAMCRGCLFGKCDVSRLLFR